MADTYTCPYCRQTSTDPDRSCPTCGAPLDVRLKTTESGWTELPPIADMARIQLGQSACQVEGKLCPVADLNLAPGEGVYFTHDVVLWQDTQVTLDNLPLARAWTRHRAGLPLVMLQATGPGHIAFSHDSPGELIALPLQAGASVDVREHVLLFASNGVSYDWFDTGVWFVASGEHKEESAGGMKLLKVGFNLARSGELDLGGEDRRDDQTQTYWPLGQNMDRFTANDRPGVVMVQVGGNAFIRDLAEGESIVVKPPALLFKDSTVPMQLHVEYPSAGLRFWRSWGNRYLWLRLWGPGRVGLQSSYPRLEDPGTDFRDVSPHTQNAW
jgi:uncharacterized protein (AIM24 family)